MRAVVATQYISEKWWIGSAIYLEQTNNCSLGEAILSYWKYSVGLCFVPIFGTKEQADELFLLH